MKFTHLAILLALVVGLTYLLTASPFTLWLDAPRFVAAIYSLGVGNPPEPLYVMLAKPFTFIPIGSIIFRIQIFSALSAVAALLVLYKLSLRQVEFLTPKALKSLNTLKALAALFSMLMLAFSYQFWSQAQNVETFILVTLIEVTCLILSLTAQTKKRFFINMSVIALQMGLSTGTNPVIASIIPALVWVMWAKRKFWTAPGFITWVVLGIMGIVGVHLYIPIRAVAGPFLNYWRATSLEGVWSVSTGAGLNVYVPELGRINGFTGSPEIFFKSTWHFIEMWVIKFTPLLLPFIVAGLIFLWRKSRFHFIFWVLIIVTNWFFSALYFSGNQESWFLISDVAWVILGGLGFFAVVTEPEKLVPARFKILKFLKSPKSVKKLKFLFLLVLVPLIFWAPTLYRRNWVLTEDYIKNLYRPMGEDKAIIFGSSDLYDSISFYTHDIPGTGVYKPQVVPITDNLFYIYQWYRDNISANSDLKMPDGSKLKYNSINEYSDFVAEFFRMNMDKYKIYVTIPAIRNNFLQAYEPQDSGLGGSLKLDDKFKLVPQGMVFQVLPRDSTISADLKNFDYQFKNKGFPKNIPKFWEQTYQSELTGVINEYAYSYEYMGDESLKSGKAEDAFKFYQKAFEFNPKNAEIISRLGNYYGSVGDHVKAAEFFEKALKIEPKNIGLLFNSAIAYANTGRVDKAIKNLNLVLQFSKGNAQIAQLARAQLDALKAATPSAQATGSADLQSQLLPKAPSEAGVYQNQGMNLAFNYPKGYTVTESSNGVILTNSLQGKNELTLNFYTRKMTAKEEIDSLGNNLPFKTEGPVLITQPITIGLFSGVGKTIGSGEHLTFLLLLRKNDQGLVVKAYPGDTAKNEEFNQILSSIKTLR